MHHSKQTQSKSIALETQGGVLQVRFEPLSSSYSDVWLCGPTKQVFKGDLEWDSSMPDGTYRKLLDVSKIHNLQWKAKISLTDGIKLTYDWYNKNHVV